MAFEYVVVEFTEELSVEIVHKSWIKSEDEGMFCYWPKKNQNQKAKKGEIPDKELWTKHPVRIFSYTDDFDKALERRARSVNTSNVDTNEEDGVEQPREVRPPLRLLNDHSDSEEEDFRPPRKSTPQPKSARPQSQLPTPPAYHNRNYSEKSGFQASRPSTSLSLSTLQARPSSSLSCSTTQASRPSSSQSVSPLQASRPFSGLSISPIGNRSRSLERGSSRSPASRRSRSPVRRRQPRILPDLETDNSRRSHSSGDQVLMALIRIENTVNENNEMLRRLVNKNTGNYGDMDLEDLVPVPIQDDLEWEEFQTRLKNTDFSKKLVHFLAALGGNKIGDTVRKICRRLALNNQWSNFSLKGKNKKKSLQAEVLHKVIIKACTRVHKNAKESEVDEAISDFLRHAPHQPGGTRYKKPTQTASTTVPDPATAQAGEYQAATESD
ncbi:unnamed protein product [Mytilus edulis]|uniref:DUF4806 domain-containing protein n=1 Tax=Mytilus edulis TaxID=6550 RepID=A0A8S3SAW4_MYTED|nr:unnamed protein product [Mytilus edulis]